MRLCLEPLSRPVAEESFEHTIEVSRRDAGTSIGNHDAALCRIGRYVHLDARVGRREAACVAEHVFNDLHQPIV
jgi:hypothetical protein